MDNAKKLMDFMNAFIDTPELFVNEEYQKIEKEYEELFGHSIPREMIPSGITENQLMVALKECIESKSDNLFDRLGIKINYDNLY